MVGGKRQSGARRPIRLGMVGGGQGAFIGAVHRIAARLDGQFELAAGAFSSDPARSAASGVELGLAPDRVYATFDEMAAREAARPDGVEAVAIVTPNHAHFEPARAFLRAGIHVICDKPLTATLADARKLAALAAQSGLVFALTHNYTGYPLIRHARELVQKNALGPIRLVEVEYVQDWLSGPLEHTGHKQAAWRTDPARSGAGGAIGDIGTHAFNLACFVSGLEAESLAADLDSFVPGRRVDDNAHILLRFRAADGGRAPKGMIWASQVAPGNENALRLRVYGEKAGIEWEQEDPNRLWLCKLGEPRQLVTRGGAAAGKAAARLTRVPAGHPEGYLEGFANLYGEIAKAIRAHRRGRMPDARVHFPTAADGLAGMRFVDACVRSSARNAAWVKL